MQNKAPINQSQGESIPQNAKVGLIESLFFVFGPMKSSRNYDCVSDACERLVELQGLAFFFSRLAYCKVLKMTKTFMVVKTCRLHEMIC